MNSNQKTEFSVNEIEQPDHEASSFQEQAIENTMPCDSCEVHSCTAASLGVLFCGRSYHNAQSQTHKTQTLPQDCTLRFVRFVSPHKINPTMFQLLRKKRSSPLLHDKATKADDSCSDTESSCSFSSFDSSSSNVKFVRFEETPTVIPTPAASSKATWNTRKDRKHATAVLNFEIRRMLNNGAFVAALSQVLKCSRDGTTVHPQALQILEHGRGLERVCIVRLAKDGRISADLYDMRTSGLCAASSLVALQESYNECVEYKEEALAAHYKLFSRNSAKQAQWLGSPILTDLPQA